MIEDQLFDMMRQALWIAVRVSMPLLAVALITGVLIGLFQALTSVQEMTITFVPKVAAMLVVFWVSMSFMTSLLASFWTDQIIPMVAGG
ncbi:MAG: flagellar biosynthetic protein FliQ [Paracoccus sp. (in: a-proteobacteria)]|nr:flagellar biosynthetic protein FliQ [Paracoccus sp. (in: a-proteobacteria)]